jgi:hypothetical protein
MNAERMQQSDIMNNIAKIIVINGFSAKHQNKCLTTMGINIGRRVPKPMDILFSHGIG